MSVWNCQWLKKSERYTNVYGNSWEFWGVRKPVLEFGNFTSVAGATDPFFIYHRAPPLIAVVIVAQEEARWTSLRPRVGLGFPDRGVVKIEVGNPQNSARGLVDGPCGRVESRFKRTIQLAYLETHFLPLFKNQWPLRNLIEIFFYLLTIFWKAWSRFLLFTNSLFEEKTLLLGVFIKIRVLPGIFFVLWLLLGACRVKKTHTHMQMSRTNRGN